MITRDEIREIAEFHSPESCALSFYYQPAVPADKSHRQEAILVKDLVREALAELGRNGRNTMVRQDMEKILAMADHLQGNSRRAKAIFACASQGIWREFDLPARISRTQLVVNQRFHLKPLAAVLASEPRVLAVLMDRTKARLFEMENDGIIEKVDFFSDLTRRGRSDGWNGYDAGHAERHVLNEAAAHFRTVSEYVQTYCQRTNCEKIAIGCRDELWSEIAPNLHATVLDRVIGQFRIDPKAATAQEVRERVDQLLAENDQRRKQNMLREVIGEANRNSRGAVGLRRVLRSLETGEIQTLIIDERLSAAGSQCINCGHLDLHRAECGACGQPMIEVTDLADALISRALAKGAELIYMAGDDDLDRVGRVAALLRFRADQSTAMKLAG